MRKYLTLARQLLGGMAGPKGKIELGYGGVSLGIPLGAAQTPKVMRHGLDPGDPTPLYTMDDRLLTGWFHGYARTPEFRQKVLYGETLALAHQDWMPIRRDALRVEDLRIEIEPTRYRLPLDLQPHADAMLDFYRATGRLRRVGPDNDWENNRTARIVELDPARGAMILQEASYFDQIATNLSVDTDSGHLPRGVLSIRRDIEPPVDGRLAHFADSALANTLGVAGVLFSRDGQPLLRERSQWLGSINASKIHCSVSGVYELPPDSHSSGRYGFELLRYGIELEIRQELNLMPGEYRLHPVALSRELPRHGKPQLFFVVLCDLPASEVIGRLRAAEESYEFQNDPNFMFRIADADHTTYRRFTYEGWAALWFARQFVEANEGRLGFAGVSRS